MSFTYMAGKLVRKFLIQVLSSIIKTSQKDVLPRTEMCFKYAVSCSRVNVSKNGTKKLVRQRTRGLTIHAGHFNLTVSTCLLCIFTQKTTSMEKVTEQATSQPSPLN